MYVCCMQCRALTSDTLCFDIGSKHYSEAGMIGEAGATQTSVGCRYQAVSQEKHRKPCSPVWRAGRLHGGEVCVRYGVRMYDTVSFCAPHSVLRKDYSRVVVRSHRRTLWMESRLERSLQAILGRVLHRDPTVIFTCINIKRLMILCRVLCSTY